MSQFGGNRPVHFFLGLLVATAAGASDVAPFTSEVQAVLDRNCVKCHGPLEQKADLRLDSAAALWKGNGDGPVAIAGSPQKSKLVQVLSAEADPHMPPMKQLSEADIAILAKWVAAASGPLAKSGPPVCEVPT